MNFFGVYSGSCQSPTDWIRRWHTWLSLKTHWAKGEGDIVKTEGDAEVVETEEDQKCIVRTLTAAVQQNIVIFVKTYLNSISYGEVLSEKEVPKLKNRKTEKMLMKNMGNNWKEERGELKIFTAVTRTTMLSLTVCMKRDGKCFLKRAKVKISTLSSLCLYFMLRQKFGYQTNCQSWDKIHKFSLTNSVKIIVIDEENKFLKKILDLVKLLNGYVL